MATMQMLWIMLAGIETVECNRLVANQTGAAVGRRRVQAPSVQIRFRAGNEKGACVSERGQAQVDGRGIEGVDRVRQFHAKGVRRIEFSHLNNQSLSKQGLAGVHRSLRGTDPRKHDLSGIRRSNRHQPFSLLTQCKT